jgi:quercetin dioxygenase-like cupin family protein
LVAIVNEADVQPQRIGKGATRRAMLTADAVPSARVIVDRLTLADRGSCEVDVPDTGLAWIQVLSGSLTVSCGEQASLTDTCVALLPPASRCRLSSASGAELLYALVPRAAELDEKFRAEPPRFKVVDWSREPVLDSKHDSRKRIYVATPQLFNTRAIKAEIISYPRGTTGSNHHHEGAEHFAYVISGSTTGYADETPHCYRAGDLVYHPDGERHFSSTGLDEEYRFTEFFVPGQYTTVWQNENRICTWLPTGRDSRGERPQREIGAHDSRSAALNCPEDV